MEILLKEACKYLEAGRRVICASEFQLLLGVSDSWLAGGLERHTWLLHTISIQLTEIPSSDLFAVML